MADSSSVAPPADGAVVLHEGWLMMLKVVSKGVADAKWNKRFFKLIDGFLLYYRTADAKTPVGWLRLSQITAVHDVPTDVPIPGAAVTPPFSFKVQLATRMLYLHAKTAEEV